ncbi:MAG TPA: sulfur carrier protein ThiS [Acidimicrobiia bacterium]|nr:sulfur carrier protein ThiS [Acidimicrobiia bacterium]
MATLVDGLGRDPRGVAVALNEDVVPRGDWPRTRLRAGDRVEVLRAAQGG